MKQAVENIPKGKIETVKVLVDLLKSKKTILVADVSSIPGSQYQQISKKLRGKAIVKVPKKNLLLRAIEDSKMAELLALKDHLNGAVAILFSDLDSYELAGLLMKNKSAAKAKPGQIAPSDIEISAGPTDLTPGPAISELGALGIQIMIKGGKIEIKEPKVVAQEGKSISAGAADMLGKLGILPFSIGFTPVSAYDHDSKTIYVDIKIDTEGTIETLKEAYGKALSFAVEVGYITEDTVKLMIQKAGAYENKLNRTINGEPDVVETSVQEAVPAEKETKKEEKKDEPVSFGAGFF